MPLSFLTSNLIGSYFSLLNSIVTTVARKIKVMFSSTNYEQCIHSHGISLPQGNWLFGRKKEGNDMYKEITKF